MYLERGEFDLAKEYSKVWVYIYKPPINFCAILLAILRHVMQIEDRVSGNMPCPRRCLPSDFSVPKNKNKTKQSQYL